MNPTTSPQDEEKSSRSREAVVVFSGVVGGFALVALVNAAAVVLLVPLPAAGLGLRLLDLATALPETLGLGAVVALVVAATVRFLPWPRAVLYAVGFVAALVLVDRVVGDYLTLHASHARGGRFAMFVRWNSYGLAAFLITAAAPASAWARRRRWGRPVVLTTVALVLVVNHLLLRDDYFAFHGLVAFGATFLVAPALGEGLAAWGAALRASRLGFVALSALALVAALGLFVVPSNRVRHELFRQPCAIAPWTLATLAWTLPALPASGPLPTSPWLGSRSALPAVPPTTPPLLPDRPVVVLVTIDALRADVFLSADHDAQFPTIAALKRDGVVFTHVTSPGAQTPTSLATLFSGRYYSELRWSDFGAGGDRFPYPATDPSPRFPKLLGERGVATVNVAGYVFLTNPYGVVRGFREETQLGHTEAAAAAPRLTEVIVRAIERYGHDRLFLYSHFGEPHAPYRLGPPGDDKQHYLFAIGQADTELGHIVEALEKHAAGRWMLIVSADHGESFGDHQTFEHAKTLYEELVHVPLVVRSARLSPARVDARVGLIDLGPTILDLFGVPTPPSFEGETLVPILEGRPATLTRPLISEARLERALTMADGRKAIEDPRRKTDEVYDLTRDPGETENLFDVDPARADPVVAWLRAFFANKTLHEGGYSPPYKP